MPVACARGAALQATGAQLCSSPRLPCTQPTEAVKKSSFMTTEKQIDATPAKAPALKPAKVNLNPVSTPCATAPIARLTIRGHHSGPSTRMPGFPRSGMKKGDFLTRENAFLPKNRKFRRPQEPVARSSRTAASPAPRSQGPARGSPATTTRRGPPQSAAPAPSQCRTRQAWS